MSSPSRPLAAAARRLADQTSDRLSGIPSDRLWIATITSIAAGASAGGNAVITVRYRGELLEAVDYCASYTPAVGHRVLCALLSDHQLVVVDRLAG